MEDSELNFEIRVSSEWCGLEVEEIESIRKDIPQCWFTNNLICTFQLFFTFQLFIFKNIMSLVSRIMSLCLVRF